MVGGRLRRPVGLCPFSAPRLRLVAELLLHCRFTAVMVLFFQGHSLQSAFGGRAFPGTGRLRLPVPRLTVSTAFQAFVVFFPMSFLQRLAGIFPQLMTANALPFHGISLTLHTGLRSCGHTDRFCCHGIFRSFIEESYTAYTPIGIRAFLLKRTQCVATQSSIAAASISSA